MTRAFRLLLAIVIILLLAHACGPLWDAIDASPCCCPAACVVGFGTVVVVAACRLSSEVEEAERRR